MLRATRAFGLAAFGLAALTVAFLGVALAAFTLGAAFSFFGAAAFFSFGAAAFFGLAAFSALPFPKSKSERESAGLGFSEGAEGRGEGCEVVARGAGAARGSSGGGERACRDEGFALTSGRAARRLACFGRSC